jgi:DNA-directed RNA polymerase subunit K/omega
MNYAALEKLHQLTVNQYEAVMLAAKTARRLNQERKKAEEGMEASDEFLPSHRVTGTALAGLASGRGKFSRP